jgi:ABC-2 type transport system ATP-binding protein
MSAIEISDLYKTFPGKRRTKVDALAGFSLTVQKGEVFGFLGPNGAGKTTTIKILMGLIKPSAGQARIAGHDTSSPLARRQVGYLPENPSFYDYLTAREYLTFVGKIFGMGDAQLVQKAEEVLRLLDLWDAKNRPIRGYSKGMVQRLGLAQALIHEPDVYILDEPMSGLDPMGRVLVKDIIIDLKQKGKTVFFSTHITADVESVCDRVGIIIGGILRSVEKVETILTEGVVGYQIRFRVAENSEAKEAYIEKNQLPAFINEMKASGHEITMIEPKRKNLEDFFVDIVKGRAA